MQTDWDWLGIGIIFLLAASLVVYVALRFLPKPKFGDRRQKSGVVVMKNIHGEARSGFQRWEEIYSERLDGLGNRILGWHSLQWID